MTADQELVDRLDEVWTSIDDLGAQLTETEWKLETECPGWTVQDQVSHLAHIEWRLLGRPDVDHTLPDDLPHVKNSFGKINEVFVDARRSWSGADVLAEFHQATRERVAALRALTPEGFGADSWTPMGPGTVRDLLPFRMFDAWVHEQDIRRAVGRPGDLDTPVAERGLGMVTASMSFVVGKKVSPPEGSVVVFSLSGPLARQVVVGIVDGRGRILDRAPDDPSVRLHMSTETFARLGCGRLDPAAIVATGDVTFDGDAALGQRVVDQMNYLF
jgi:uncharacterized protein (TIGR03083 family)